jgi:hypothetical protein
VAALSDDGDGGVIQLLAPMERSRNMDRESNEASKARASMPVRQISVEDFTQVAFEGVLRAIESRNREDLRLPYGP